MGTVEEGQQHHRRQGEGGQAAALIPLRDRHGTVIAEAIVDPDDFDMLNANRWSLARSTGYVVRSTTVEGVDRTFAMHRVVLGLGRTGRGVQVDHDNRDKLDNRKANLIVTTAGGNARNRATPCASAIPGVTWDERTGRWCAWGYRDGRTVWLGRHATEAEAAAAGATWRAG